MRVLYIGGTGEISAACVDASAQAGHKVSVFNRGKTGATTDPNITYFHGDLGETDPYRALEHETFDVICQFLAFSPDQIKKDVEFFRERCRQYILISSASVYEKLPGAPIITESTPLTNPHWQYAQQKIACEAWLKNSDIPFTIVRPSHTYRTRMPGTVIHGDHQTWRILNHKPIIIHGDGESLWTLTHANDFANAFLKLFLNPATQREAFHITSDQPSSWNNIIASSGAVMGVEPETIHIGTDQLVETKPEWTGPLLGDKANSLMFDNTKLRAAIGDWQAEINLIHGLKLAWEIAEQRISSYSPDPELDREIDRLISEVA